MLDTQVWTALRRLTERQEATITAINGLADVLQTQTEMLEAVSESLADLKAWLQEPPSNELPELLKRLTLAVEGMPAAVVRALRGHGVNGEAGKP